MLPPGSLVPGLISGAGCTACDSVLPPLLPRDDTGETGEENCGSGSEGESASGDDSVEKLESERPDASVSTNHSVTGLPITEQPSMRLGSLR